MRPDAPARVVLVGLGGAAERILLPAFTRLPQVSVVAGCDLDGTRRDAASHRWSIPRVYADAAPMLAEQQPDVVVVATPPLQHGAPCLLALESGCHVFCEKPFMPTLEDADRVVAAAVRAKRRVAVNNQYYQMPIFRRLKAILDSGQAGRLYHIAVWQMMQLLPSAEGGWKSALQPRRVLYEFGTHALDLVCQFFGAYPVAVSARIPRVPSGVDADVLVVMRLDFPGERVATVVLNRVSHAPPKYLEMRLDCEQASLRASLGGVASLELGWNSVRKRPRLRFSLASGGEARWQSAGGSRTLARQPYGAFHQASALHFAQFLSAARHDREPAVSAAHAREVLRAVFAGYASAAQNGALVTIASQQPAVAALPR